MIYVLVTHLKSNGRAVSDPLYEEGLENALNRIAKEGGRVLHLLASAEAGNSIVYTIVYEVFQGGRFLNEEIHR